MKKVFPRVDIKTLQEGINRLISLEILTPINETLYYFDDIPLEYKIKTISKNDEISAEEAYQLALIHNKTERSTQ